MRGGLLFLGILLLLVGAALYFLVPGVSTNVRYARDTTSGVTLETLPFIGLVAMGLGALFTILGLVIPGPSYRYREEDYVPVERTRTVVRDSRGRVKREHVREVRRED